MLKIVFGQVLAAKRNGAFSGAGGMNRRILLAPRATPVAEDCPRSLALHMQDGVGVLALEFA